eukprot:4460309-Alexandrium_andersonii.AAC.1
MDFPAEACHLMLVHAKATRITGDSTLALDWVIAPAIVESTSTQHLLGGLQKRLPLSLAELAGSARRFII